MDTHDPAGVVPHPGLRVGNYLLQERIGEGAFGQAWTAIHHERPGSIVAVKLATHPDYRRHLAREGRLPQFDHRNLLAILDSDTRSADLPYVVMPYCAGGSLARLIEAHPSGLPEDRVAALMKDILSGLDAAHRRDVVHRDLKPHNVLLDDSGRALIADFGLSLNGAADNHSRSLVHSLSIEAGTKLVGTLAYMAPEVREGDPATPAADVYSLGVLLFEMLTGRRPTGVGLPSQSRNDLKRSAYWDALYYRASCGTAERYRDAGSMLAAMIRGPAPLPFGPATPALAPLPPPTPLPDDLWEGLRTRYEERLALVKLRRTHALRLYRALRIYTEEHREVRALREHETRLQDELHAAHQRLEEVCARIVESLNEQIAALSSRRDALLADGCRQNHPSVREIDENLAPLRDLAAQVEEIPRRVRIRKSGSRRGKRRGVQLVNLLACMKAWIRAGQQSSAAGYEDFIMEFGAEPANPWAPAARRNIQRIRNNRSRSARTSTAVRDAAGRGLSRWLLWLMFLAGISLLCLTLAACGTIE